jgi:hypothetical protein
MLRVFLTFDDIDFRHYRADGGVVTFLEQRLPQEN